MQKVREKKDLRYYVFDMAHGYFYLFLTNIYL